MLEQVSDGTQCACLEDTGVLGQGLAAFGRARAVRGRFTESVSKPLLPWLHTNWNPSQGEVTPNIHVSDVVFLTGA